MKAPRVKLVDRKVSKKKALVSAGLSDWQNLTTPLTPSRLVEAFMCDADVSLQADMQRVWSAWKTDGPRAAKSLFSSVPLSEFSTQRPDLVAQWLQFGALFLKSTDGLSRPEERKKTAIAAFLASNQRCKRYTRKLRYYRERPHRMPESIRVVVTRARSTIARLLGPWSWKTYWKLIELARPGSGSAIGTRDKDCVSPPFKYGYTDLVCTADAFPHARELVEGSPVWQLCHRQVSPSLEYRIVSGDEITTVSKDAGSDRTIGIGPALNVCLQLGVHEYVTPRMAAWWGVTLSDQQRNVDAAHHGSANWLDPNGLVTLDLKDSSNTNCLGMVELLLPDDGWLDFLREIRSPSFRVGDAPPEDYYIWSCMGNGYTFVLQCMMYYALAEATCWFARTERDNLRVYGDDIIVPRGAALLLVEVLQWMGCAVNRDKSYLFGPFRESCGGDFFAGTRVTPTYIRGRKRLRLVELYNLLNRLYGTIEGAEESGDLLAVVLLHTLAKYKNPLVPEWFSSDAGLRTRERVGFRWKPEQAMYCLRVAFTPNSVRHDPTWGYAAALRGARDLAFWEEFGFSAKRARGFYSLVASPLWGRVGAEV